jgi:hypothetical protein
MELGPSEHQLRLERKKQRPVAVDECLPLVDFHYEVNRKGVALLAWSRFHERRRRQAGELAGEKELRPSKLRSSF